MSEEGRSSRRMVPKGANRACSVCAGTSDSKPPTYRRECASFGSAVVELLQAEASEGELTGTVNGVASIGFAAPVMVTIPAGKPIIFVFALSSPCFACPCAELGIVGGGRPGCVCPGKVNATFVPAAAAPKAFPARLLAMEVSLALIAIAVGSIAICACTGGAGGGAKACCGAAFAGAKDCCGGTGGGDAVLVSATAAENRFLFFLGRSPSDMVVKNTVKKGFNEFHGHRSHVITSTSDVRF